MKKGEEKIEEVSLKRREKRVKKIKRRKSDNRKGEERGKGDRKRNRK